jgi:hypothetical protein
MTRNHTWVAVAVGRTGKQDGMGRRACGVCWICFHEKEGIGTSLWLGGGMREWKKDGDGKPVSLQGRKEKTYILSHSSPPTPPWLS